MLSFKLLLTYLGDKGWTPHHAMLRRDLDSTLVLISRSPSGIKSLGTIISYNTLVFYLVLISSWIAFFAFPVLMNWIHEDDNISDGSNSEL